MKQVYTISLVGAVCGTVFGLTALATSAHAGMDDPADPSGTSLPATIELTGVVRDFKTSHPDFETFPSSGFSAWNSANGVYENLVKEDLGEDGKPVFNDDLLNSRGWSNIPIENEQPDVYYRDLVA